MYRPRRSHFPTDSPKLGYTDVSRWGRFLNNYEGLTTNWCVPEPEYRSSNKVFRGKSRLVQMGYWFGGQSGYGRVPNPPEFGLPL